MYGKVSKKNGEVPRDYVTEEGIVVGDEWWFELCLGVGEVGKSWGGHWNSGGFLSGSSD